MNTQPQLKSFLKATASIILMLMTTLVIASQTVNDAQTLLPNQTLEREMLGAETHRYKFDLKAEEFFQVRIEQKGVDVALKLTDANSRTLVTMDSPNSKEGPEILSFVADKAGSFILEIHGFDTKAEKGIYSISRVASRTATISDKRRIKVEKLFVEGITAINTEGQGEIAIKKFEAAVQGWQELKDEYLAQLTASLIKQLKVIKANAISTEAVGLFRQGTAESYKTALNKFQEVSRLYEEINDKSEDYGISLFISGFISNNLGEKSAAADFYKKALLFFQINNYKKSEATTLTNLGSLHNDLGEKQKALEYHNLALLIYRQVADKLGEATALTNIGLLYGDLGEKQKALKYYDQSLALYKEVGGKGGEARTLSNIGKIHDDLGEKQKALEFYNEALPLSRQVGDKTGEATALNNIGKIHDDLGEKQKALEFYNEALPLSRQVGDKTGEATALNNIGKVYDDLGEKQKALEYFNQVLPLFKQVGNKTGEATALNNIGEVYDGLGEKQKALEFYNQALSLSRQVGDKKGEATRLNNIGKIHDDLGEKQKALEFYNEALPLSRQVGDKTGEATALNNIGAVYSVLGEKQKALEYYNQALSLSRQVGDKTGEATTLTNLGGAYNDLGEKQKALEFYNEALPLSRQVGDKTGEATALNNIGIIYSALGEKQKALEYYTQVLLLIRQVGDKKGEATTLGNIGAVYSALEENQKALEFYNQALSLSRQVGDKTGEATELNNIGLIYSVLGEKQKALEYYNQALSLSRQVGDKTGEAIKLNNIGIIYSALEEKQKALEYYNQALSLSGQVGDKTAEAVTLSNMMALWNSLNNRQLAIFYGKQSINASQQLRANIKDLNKLTQQTYLKSVEGRYRDLADILIADSRLPEAQAVLELLKEEEFSGLVRRGGGAENIPYSKTEDAALKILNNVAALGREKSELSPKKEKGTLTTAERARFLELDDKISIAEAEFDKSLKVLSSETSKGQNFDVVVSDAQAFMEDLGSLGGGTVALYTVIINGDKTGEQKNEPIKTGWIILVTPEFRKAYPIDVKDLEQTVSAFRASLISPEYDPQPLAQILYKKLFLQTSDKQKTTLAADLDEYFKGKREKVLMWSLDGVLRYVPMAVLHDGTQYLVEKYRNTVFNTASKARLKDAPKKRWSVLALGVSREREESGKHFPALSGVKRELETLIKLKRGAATAGIPANQGILPGRVELDDEFTREAMYDALFDNNPVVHIASHFSYNPADFDQSFLLLGKGSLTVKDLSSKSTLFSNVDLLTLSACETGIGGANGKETEGFAYVAQSLGAKSVVATLWQVDDAGTQILMPEFYRLHETGITKAEALRQAQIAFLRGKKQNIPAGVKRSDLAGIQPGADAFNLTRFTKDPARPYAHPYFWAPFVLIGNWK